MLLMLMLLLGLGLIMLLLLLLSLLLLQLLSFCPWHRRQERIIVVTHHVSPSRRKLTLRKNVVQVLGYSAAAGGAEAVVVVVAVECECIISPDMPQSFRFATIAMKQNPCLLADVAVCSVSWN